MRAFATIVTCVAVCLKSSTAFQVLHNSTTKKDVLVVVIGQLRGGEMAWESLRRRLLKPWNADLALMTDIKDERNLRSSLFKDVVYKWHVPEPDDWGDVLDKIPGIREDWRAQICPMLEGQFLGGVKNCHTGSSGILLASRYLLQQHLRQLRSDGVAYKWVVLTRADYLYGCDLPSLHNFSKVDGQHFVADAYNVPDEQGYRGITDRFSVLPGDLADKVLDVPRYLLSEPDFWKELGVHGRGSCHGKRICNLEGVLASYCQRAGIKYHTYRHPAFTVRQANDPGSWSQGHHLETLDGYDLMSRYPDEFKSTMAICSPEAVVRELASLHKAAAALDHARLPKGSAFRLHVGNDTFQVPVAVE